MAYLGYFMGEVKYGNFKIGCITCKWTSKRPEKMLQMIFVKFSLCIRTCKNYAVNWLPENVASWRILSKMAASVFHIIYKKYQNFFAGINHLYMDIYHAKKQTEISLVHVVICFWKHWFISHRSILQHPILKVACVNLTSSWTTAILHSFSQETDLLMKVIMKCVNINFGIYWAFFITYWTPLVHVFQRPLNPLYCGNP